MMAEHGNICSGQEETFCMNGGTCYKLPDMNSLSCMCQSMYAGSRCETFSLFTFTENGHNAGVVAAVVIVVILVLLAVAVFIYYIIKRRQLRGKQQQQQNSHQKGDYWKVPPRV
ncbi:pro-neuregulin-4, membrane-bound isoform [Boleophthalmus pectinirostris]|uniref:pro-neuregulin-4, membrane-bound isoform n=1 Tax=Boleophthalmus pectinirostris TaxID=150288 RepID=UPI000A1C4408|nr:pro-neuregulin-4, membrane-bound isoform [Boleophthalmus pectinirostris]XP_020776406.1 pro-neuregulin-4, membrane-bound isoform [Boleophthalmus pectinirostris]